MTKKGKGYGPAEAANDKYHGVNAFDIVTGKQNKPKANAPAYTKVFADALVDEASRDPKIVAITAAMPSGTGLDTFGKAYPDRSFDVGIAEQHAVTFAAGLATEGYKPFCAIYSTFLQRGYDQLVHDVALQNLPVRFAIDRAGLVGADGATHAGAFDVAYLACLPNMVVMAAADEAELKHMVATCAAHDSGPIALRYPRGEGVGVDMPEHGEVLEIGKGRIVREGSRIAILSLGTRLAEAVKAAEDLDARGLSTTVADARFAKPLDRRADPRSRRPPRGAADDRGGRRRRLRRACADAAGRDGAARPRAEGSHADACPTAIRTMTSPRSFTRRQASMRRPSSPARCRRWGLRPRSSICAPERGAARNRRAPPSGGERRRD